MLSAEHSKQKEVNRSYLQKILQNLIYLARQGLPMRGNWMPVEEGIGCEEDSNFHQLMLLRTNDDETVGLTYRKVLPPALWIWENMYCSHIQFFNFSDSKNLFGMTDRCETFRDFRTTIPLSSLKVSNLYTIACDFYGSPNKQNQMCKLCTFSQIRSHMMLHFFLTI